VFIQRAGVVAIEQGEEIIKRTQTRYTAARDFLCSRLSQPFFREAGLIAPVPQGAMYVFFKIQGLSDSFALCKSLVT
jgi:aspartate/methionine/tyrosine aminotransferase